MEVLHSPLAAHADLGGSGGDNFLSFSFLPRTKKREYYILKRTFKNKNHKLPLT